MPLPFLTADSAFDAQDDDSALPYDDHGRWRRPYRPGPWRVAAGALLLLLASFMLLATMIIAFTGEFVGALVCLAAAGLVIALALRMLRMGTWVSPQGLRRVALLSTRTYAWSDVDEVRTSQQPVRWLGLPRTVQGQALTVKPRAAQQPVLLLTDHNADFLSRTEAFERAADLVAAWADEYRAVPVPQAG
ncbi:PH domain-containing protein [Streptomyces bambusae]|uniref:PH domain-containing protein n=1 Tax=Streptomyces bambusae TaxID=1550616 RepID=UPI001CFF63C2|nr:PH domain-containing protein [Streptomyces bambusae]MCB5169951.1 PH domain-containing protein [Streptomyces bambusae]